MTKKTKVLLIVILCLVLAAAIGAGIWFFAKGSSEPVGVYSFDYIGMTEYWGDSQESYGPVTTDRIQTVFLSDTQTVTEVLVNQGDMVKKGDPLLAFDTTLSDLQLERKRLEVEKLRLQLEEAERTLQKIRNMKPMTIPSPDYGFVEDTYLGAELTLPYKTYIVAGHDGTSMATPFVCRLRDDTVIDDLLLETLRQAVWGDLGLCKHGYALAECPTCNCTHGLDCEICTPCIHGVPEHDCTICSPVICVHNNIEMCCEICHPPICIHGEVADQCGICTLALCPHGVPVDYCTYCNPTCIHGAGCTECAKYCEHNVLRESCPVCTPPSTEDTSGADGLSASQGTPYTIQLLSNTSGEASLPNSYYVVFKITQGNAELGAATVWQGVHVKGMGDDFSLSYFTPAIMDYTIPEEDEDPSGSIGLPDIGSGYTSAQIAEMRAEQEEKIKNLTLEVKMADAEYQIMLKEVGDGFIYAEFDGEVVALISQEEAKDSKLPILKLSGGGGFYIEGSVSELEKDNLEIGQEVTINDWSTGGMYTGTVKSIGDFPSQGNGWNGMGNPNATYYPFTVFVGEEADLQAGAYVSIQYSTAESTNGIYLEKAFLRTEQGTSYVYVQGADGRLEKHYVTTGKSLWGSYTEILSGLTPEDLIAFPYGKHVREGAPTEESDIASLYGY